MLKNKDITTGKSVDIVVIINMFRLGMGTHANPQKIWLKASTRLHTVDKYCTGGYYKRLREQCPFWGCPDFMDADMPPLTKGIEVFLRFAYAPIPKLFNDLQSERYFENRYSLIELKRPESFISAHIKSALRNGFRKY